jgi:hypothetical protein
MWRATTARLEPSEDNAWNAALARTLPDLIVALLRWIAKTATPAAAAAAAASAPTTASAAALATALAASYALVPLTQFRKPITAPPPVEDLRGGGREKGESGQGQKRDRKGHQKGGRGNQQQQQRQQQQVKYSSN